MKKIFVLLASVLMFASCNNESNFEVAFIDFTKEEKALFNEEISISDTSFLAGLAEDYKVSSRSPIQVYKLPEEASYGEDFLLDKKFAAFALACLELEGLTDEMLDNLIQQSYEFNDQQGCAAMYCELGANWSVASVLFSDEVSYISWPLKVEEFNALYENSKDSLGAEYSDTVGKAMLNLVWIANGQVGGFYSGVNRTLSNGQKVRIYLTAEAK